MSFQIGAVTLPVLPSEATYKKAQDSKTIRRLTALPIVLPLGPKTPVLSLKGKLWKEGFTAAQIESDYIIPFDGMVNKEAVFPRTIADDGQASFWTAYAIGSGSYGISIADDSSTVKRGKNSLKMTIGAGPQQWVGVTKDYGSFQDFSKKDFVALWYYHSGTADYWYVRFMEDATGAHCFYQTFSDSGTGWVRHFWRLDEFAVTGSPSWKKIRYIRIDSPPTVGKVCYLDRTVLGVGRLIQAPDSRYDGIYIPTKFDFKEKGGFINVFDYDLELMSVDDYY